VKASTKKVYILKQWHLDPTEDTLKSKKVLPQAENQNSIYEQMKEWIDSGEMKTVLAEGCTGEIKEDFAKRFNGWGMQDLLAKKDDPTFAKIQTHVPMKLKAFYGEKLQALCVDDEKIIKDQLLQMSDIRGDTGYLTRIEEFKDEPNHQRVYVDSAKEALKLPKNKKTDDVVKALKKDIDAKIKTVQEGISTRNKVIVENIKKINSPEMALIIGGLHAPELKKLLEKENIGCEILEPNGYKEE
jgi:hypothetical protein